MKLSVVMPVYNEAGTVREVVGRVLAEAHEKEIIIVDDGSTDGSRDVLAEIASEHNGVVRLVLHEVNRGKGAAIRTGIGHVQGDIVLIQDADLEYSPDDYGALVAPLLEGRTDVVYGSRFLNRDAEFLPASRAANRFLTLLTNVLYGARLTDMETCYKVIRTPLAKSLPLRSEAFEIEPEITAKLLKRGAKIVEVPVQYKARGFVQGKKIGWRDGLQAVWTLLRYRFSD